MARPGAIVAAMKAIPGGARHTPAPQSSGMGRISPVQAEAFFNNSYANAYGPFLDRPSRVFTDGAFAPMSPIQPVPVDVPPPGGQYPDPRWWEYRVGWNLPTPPGSEGLKLASFSQLKTIADRYSVARQCIELRKEEIRGLEWEITLTTDAAKAYQGDRNAMRDFGERKAEVTKFFRHPDPDFWNFSSFLDAMLEEIFVLDALSLVFRPKYGASFGMGGRGLLGSELDSLNLVSGMTIRPLLGLHGETPRPKAPAYQQFLYGVPRSDFITLIQGTDIDDYGLRGAEVNEFSTDMMLYAPFVPRRETKYGFPPVERALLPIISGLQKQEFQLDYYTEGTVPAVYISPGDPNITPTQIGELQNALNSLAGDPAYHLKVVVLPPGSKVEPQRPVDLSDSFDYLVMNQVAMAFDVLPTELGIIPDIGGTQVGPSASGVKFAGQEARNLKSRKSTKPLLAFLCDVFNYAIQDICGQRDMQFQFEGLVDDEDKQAITELGVQQVQNAIASIDEIRDRLDLPPWGLKETSEPVVFTAQGPVSLETSQQLILMAAQGKTDASGQGANSGQNARRRPSQPSIRAGGQTRPNGSHPAPVAPHREAPATPQHNAAQGAIQSPGPRTGGTTSRTSVAGSRKKAAVSELDALKRHLRKGREITSWDPVNISHGTLAVIAEDIAKGVLLDTAIDRALDMTGLDWFKMAEEIGVGPIAPLPVGKSVPQFPGWQQDLGLIGQYKEQVSQAFRDAEIRGSQLRKDAATGKMYVSSNILLGLISDQVRDVFLHVMTPMWEKAWDLGYDSACYLLGKTPGDSTSHRQGFLDTEGAHWLDQVARTGLGNPAARSDIIARTEVARAMNAGAMQCYRDSGVTYKHLLISPDERACEACLDAADDGDIPLDAPFSSGGLSGPVHPQCRCVPAPAGIEAEPPQAHLGKRFITIAEAKQRSLEDDSRVAWLLIRARDESGKWRYLLQQRDDGSWGMPGGTAHIGEEGWDVAVRETTEEVGDLPQLAVKATLNHIDPDGVLVYLYLCECSFFRPKLNGSTPEETRGVAWFRRKEVGSLDLVPKFRDDWDHIISDALDGVSKSAQNLVTENGERLVLDDPDRHGAGLGSRWPYPHRADGTEWPDAGPGAVPGNNAGDEPPRHSIADHEEARIYPRGSEDEEFPRRRMRNKPAGRFPDDDPGEGGKYPQGGIGSDPGRQGIPKSVPHLVTGSVPARAGKPSDPHSEPPEAFDPAETTETLTPEGNAVYDLPKAAQRRVKKPLSSDDADLADPRKPGGPSDYDDPNETDPEHILSQLRSNFPEAKIQWVKDARWIGPIEIPWERVDTDSIDTWAASHQLAAVNRFAADIKANRGHTNPSIMVQRPGKDKAFIVDGHHRALARHKLGKPVLAYIGFIQGKDTLAAEETHSSQFHSGSDPENK